MVVLTITNDGSSDFAEQSRKPATATASMTMHTDRDIIIPGERNPNSQLSQ